MSAKVSLRQRKNPRGGSAGRSLSQQVAKEIREVAGKQALESAALAHRSRIYSTARAHYVGMWDAVKHITAHSGVSANPESLISNPNRVTGVITRRVPLYVTDSVGWGDPMLMLEIPYSWKSLNAAYARRPPKSMEFWRKHGLAAAALSHALRAARSKMVRLSSYQKTKITPPTAVPGQRKLELVTIINYPVVDGSLDFIREAFVDPSGRVEATGMGPHLGQREHPPTASRLLSRYIAAEQNRPLMTPIAEQVGHILRRAFNSA